VDAEFFFFTQNDWQNNITKYGAHYAETPCRVMTLKIFITLYNTSEYYPGGLRFLSWPGLLLFECFPGPLHSPHRKSVFVRN